MSMIGMFFNGLAGTVETFAPPVISMAWFPTHERSTATGIMATANYIGSAVGFLPSFYVPSDGPVDKMKSSLWQVYIFWAALSLILLLLVLLKFPSKPATSPSKSSSHSQIGLLDGLKELINNGKFWTIVLCCACPVGIFSMWINVLGINFKKFKNIGIDQESAGLIGILSVSAGCIMGIISGILADKFDKKLKIIVTTLYSLATLCFLWFTLMYVEIIPPSKVAVYGSVIVGGFCMYGTYPLFFEMCMETAYPNVESVIVAFMVVSQAVVQSLFLLVPVNDEHTEWMNWTLVGSIFFFVVILIFFKEDYKRLDVDLNAETSNNYNKSEKVNE